MTNSSTNSAALFTQISLLNSDANTQQEPQKNENPNRTNTEFSAQSQAAAVKRQALPPMLTQYLEYKEKYSECIIFFQVGDFYEVFFEDAIKVAKALNITLTSRDKSSDQPIAMCGVPVAALDGYLDRLVDQGFSAAVVSQQNSSSFSRLPAAYKEENSNSKLVISRQLSRIVTPGIRLLSDNQSHKDSSFIVAIHIGHSTELKHRTTGAADISSAAFAYCEAQSAKIFCKTVLSESELVEEIVKISPSEIVLPSIVDGNKLDGRSSLVRKLQARLPASVIKYRQSQQNIAAQQSATVQQGSTRNLDQIAAYQALEKESKHAVISLINYIDETTNGAKISFSTFEADGLNRPMLISSTTRNNLELLSSPTAGVQCSVLSDLNSTKTAAGSRMFRSWLLRPLTDKNVIESRYDLIEYFISNHYLCLDLRKSLDLCPDLERIASRIELNCVTPRELGAVRQILRELRGSQLYMQLFKDAEKYSQLNNICKQLKTRTQLLDLLESQLEEDLPAQAGEGYIIRQNINQQLDQYRSLHKQGKSWVQEFEQREQAATGLSNLRVKFNYVLGFFIEVTKSNAQKLPEYYEKRQSTVNAERFVTKELKEQEKLVLSAEENSLALERELYNQLKAALAEFSPELRNCGQAIAELDVMLSLADTAVRRNFVRPELSNNKEFLLEQGKHPVVETALGSSFVPNSLSLDPDKQHSGLILTGPNMGGKSTFLRQAGILVIMAQMGSFVPAKSLKLGIVDQIFARIGASDNIAGGESTFMVEMKEVVQIVSASTDRSLILIDEVGRGTSTKDGEALAQAIVEWIVEHKSCRMLFATHFHNLTNLCRNFSQLDNISVQATESRNEIIFTHKIVKGPAGQSYGLEVAKLAGLPQEIIQRGRQLVMQLRNNDDNCADKNIDKISITSEVQQTEEQANEFQQAVLKSLEMIDINNTSPVQALNIIIDLQRKLKENE